MWITKTISPEGTERYDIFNNRPSFMNDTPRTGESQEYSGYFSGDHISTLPARLIKHLRVYIPVNTACELDIRIRI